MQTAWSTHKKRHPGVQHTIRPETWDAKRNSNKETLIQLNRVILNTTRVCWSSATLRCKHPQNTMFHHDSKTHETATTVYSRVTKWRKDTIQYYTYSIYNMLSLELIEMLLWRWTSKVFWVSSTKITTTTTSKRTTPPMPATTTTATRLLQRQQQCWLSGPA